MGELCLKDDMSEEKLSQLLKEEIYYINNPSICNIIVRNIFLQFLKKHE